MSFKQLVKTIACALVDDPDQVEVDQIEQGDTSILELRVAPEDIGKVIGKDGRTAQSIRAVLLAASAKAGRRVQLDILD
ncbi:MAG TPA: KH domain-containing protein [Polyangiaceae bacterium]|jgi:hypothetical protein|nr:KH domain-containing protein [Polyangiaceae bacterium]